MQNCNYTRDPYLWEKRLLCQINDRLFQLYVILNNNICLLSNQKKPNDSLAKLAFWCTA